MKDFITTFRTIGEYNTWKSSARFVEPNATYISDDESVITIGPPHDYSQDYLTFTALENTTFTFTQNALQYSLDDGTTWTTLAANTASPMVTAGNNILWKQTGLTAGTEYPSYGIGTFSSTGNFEASGNVMSLYYGDNFSGETSLSSKNYAFCKLFFECTKLMGVENLSLPATTLAENCYADMFNGCTSLTTAPELPAITLANMCYSNMFYNCTSLTTAPELPATTLAICCYGSMFGDCTSLTTAPALPAETLVGDCYMNMFDGCTSLATAPELPATTLAQNCYWYMFHGCTSLTTAPELPATTLVSYCYQYMFSGCTALTTAPELPATTLASYCYQFMFQGCTALTTAPELPATTLADACYNRMFIGCTNLNYIKCLATNISASYCTYNWVSGVAATGTFVKPASTNWSSKTGYDGIPSGWTVQIA